MTDFMPTHAPLQTATMPGDSGIVDVGSIWRYEHPVQGQLPPSSSAELRPIVHRPRYSGPDAGLGHDPIDIASVAKIAPRALRDPLSWTLVKHLCQLAIISLAGGFALIDGISIATSLLLAAAALMLMLAMVVADRMRFIDADPQVQIVEFVVADTPVPCHAAAPRDRELQQLDLAAQMAASMPAHISVT